SRSPLRRDAAGQQELRLGAARLPEKRQPLETLDAANSRDRPPPEVGAGRNRRVRSADGAVRLHASDGGARRAVKLNMMPQTYTPLQAPQRLLFGPGPSMVAPRVYQAMAQPVVGHLDPFFFQVVEEIRTLLGYAFSTKNQFNIAVSGTGSAGMETAVANLLEPGEKFALLTNGFFGDRIGEMARRHGGEVVRLSKPWGEPFDPQEVREFIRREH